MSPRASSIVRPLTLALESGRSYVLRKNRLHINRRSYIAIFLFRKKRDRVLIVIIRVEINADTNDITIIRRMIHTCALSKFMQNFLEFFAWKLSTVSIIQSIIINEILLFVRTCAYCIVENWNLYMLIEFIDGINSVMQLNVHEILTLQTLQIN